MSWEEARDVAKHPVVGGTIPTTEGHSPRSQQCQGIDTDSQGPPPRLLSQFFASRGQSIGVSSSASVLPMNIQG